MIISTYTLKSITLNKYQRCIEGLSYIDSAFEKVLADNQTISKNYDRAIKIFKTEPHENKDNLTYVDNTIPQSKQLKTVSGTYFDIRRQKKA